MDGLRFSRWCATGELSETPLPRPRPLRWALFAVWEDDDALDRFLLDSPLVLHWRDRAREAYHLRMRPVRTNGVWGGSDPLGGPTARVGDDEPVAVLTYGNLKYRNALRFFRWNARAVREMRRQEGAMAALGLLRPPRTVITFSIWRSFTDMRTFAYGEASPDHRAAMQRMHDEDWHREWLFARFRPYAAEGTLGGRDPLAEAERQRAARPAARAPDTATSPSLV